MTKLAPKNRGGRRSPADLLKEINKTSTRLEYSEKTIRASRKLQSQGGTGDPPTGEPGAPVPVASSVKGTNAGPRSKDAGRKEKNVTEDLLRQRTRELTVMNRELLDEIRERFRIEEELSRTEKMYRNVVEQSPAITYLAEPNETGTLQYVSPQIRSLGYTPEEWIDHPSLYFERLHPDDRHRVMKEWRRCLAEGSPFRAEYRIVSRDGRTVWLHDNAVPLADDSGVITSWHGMLVDISERVRAEQALRESEERIRMLLEALPLRILIFRNGKLIFQNQGTAGTADNAGGKDGVPAFLAVIPEDADRLERFWYQVFSGMDRKVDTFRVKEDPRDADSALQWFRIQSSPVSFEREMATLVIVTDITRYKEMEERAITREKLASLGVMSAGIAHEIRNPLSGITLYASALEHHLDRTEIDPESRQALSAISRHILEGTERISSVIQHIMNFSKPTPPSFVSTDVNAVVGEAVRLLSSTIRLDKVKIRKSLAAELPPCHGDPTLLRQIIMNLILNSLTAMKEKPERRRLEITTSAENGEILLTISDSGHGVPVHLREKIFDPFFSTKQGGFGIGLSFSRRVLDEHGGRIRTGESRWGGARFDIVLPAGNRAAAS